MREWSLRNLYLKVLPWGVFAQRNQNAPQQKASEQTNTILLKQTLRSCITTFSDPLILIPLLCFLSPSGQLLEISEQEGRVHLANGSWDLHQYVSAWLKWPAPHRKINNEFGELVLVSSIWEDALSHRRMWLFLFALLLLLRLVLLLWLLCSGMLGWFWTGRVLASSNYWNKYVCLMLAKSTLLLRTTVTTEFSLRIMIVNTQLGQVFEPSSLIEFDDLHVVTSLYYDLQRDVKLVNYFHFFFFLV